MSRAEHFWASAKFSGSSLHPKMKTIVFIIERILKMGYIVFDEIMRKTWCSITHGLRV